MKNTHQQSVHLKKQSAPSSPHEGYYPKSYVNQENIKHGKQMSIQTQSKLISSQNSHLGSQTSKNADVNNQKRQGGNFFKELTNSLYDQKQGGQVIATQSRQYVNQAASGAFSAKNSIAQMQNHNVKMNSVHIIKPEAFHQRRDSQQQQYDNVLIMSQASSQQQSPMNLTTKMASLKKKFTTSGVQNMHPGNQAAASISNQSSSCNVTLSQSSQQTTLQKGSITSTSSAIGSRKNSKDQQQANKPYVNSKSPTPISILSQNQSNNSRQNIQNVPATLSPKEMNKNVFIFKQGAQSPVSTPSNANQNFRVLQQNSQNHSRQSQQSPLNASNIKRSQQTSNGSVVMSVNQNHQPSSTKNQSQIFQKVYELKKKYTNGNDNQYVPVSAPISQVGSPDTRNQHKPSSVLSGSSGYQQNYQVQSNNSSTTNLSFKQTQNPPASTRNLNQKTPMQNNFFVSKGKDQQSEQPYMENSHSTKINNIYSDSSSQGGACDNVSRILQQMSQRSPAASPTSHNYNYQQINPRSAKEQIILHIGKYIKRKNSQQEQNYNEQQYHQEESDDVVSEEILQNLREFLSYLEDKNIINTSKLEGNKDEMNNLIKDLMKLDLNKFSKPRCNSSQRRGSASPNIGPNVQIQNDFPQANQNIFNQRHNSQQNFVNNQNNQKFNFQQQDKSESNSKEGSFSQRNNGQQSTKNQPVPTIQLMINTNVNQKVIYSNNMINNYNYYPGNPQPQVQEYSSTPQNQHQQVPLSTKNGLIGRRGSDTTVLQQNQQKQQSQPILQNQLNSHKRNVSDNNLLMNKQESQSQKILQQVQQQQQQKGHRKNAPSVVDQPTNNVSSRNNNNERNGPTVQTKSNNNVSELQKSVLSVDDMLSGETPKEGVTLNESIIAERDKIIKFIKAYIKKHNEIPPTTLDYYKFVKLIGKGAFGKVTLGVHKLTGKYVAIKTIDKSYMKDEYSRRKVFQEVYILKKIRHSCVIRLLEVFESPKHFLMVMEYAGGGDLLQYVKKRKRLDEDTSRAIFKQIVYGLGHCNCRSVLHRDIKLDNVLMDGEGGVKLCDFGVSRLVKNNQIIKEQCGTPAYLAPEIIIDEGYEGFYADVWSLGVLLYAMLQGTVPFKANNIADLHKLILKGDFDFAHDSITDSAKDLIRRMLVLTPEKRILIPDMLNHPWVKEQNNEGFGDNEDDDDEHDLKVGATFFRQECMNGIIGPTNGQMDSGNINFVNVENLYYKSTQQVKSGLDHPKSKIKYSDYCALTEDFMTYRIDEEALAIVEGYGYNRKMVIDSINKGEINHATASYYLLIHSTNQ